MKVLVFVPDDSGPRWVAAFRAARPDWAVVQWRNGDPPATADYAAAWAPSAEFLANGPFKAVMNLGAGVDAILKLPNLAAVLKGAPLIRLNDAGMAAQMAEFACHALAREARGFAAYEERQREGQWKKRPHTEKSEWPVGVMGVGSIGQVIARAIAGFDYPVHGWSRTPKEIVGLKVYAGNGELAAFLAATRVLVLALPLTAGTRHVIDAPALAQLVDGAMVINVGRGALIDDAALLAALDSGKVVRAALDVFATEPLPAGHAYWTHPKVNVTPHISGTTLVEPGAAQIVDKIDALERGEAVEGVVEIGRGY